MDPSVEAPPVEKRTNLSRKALLLLLFASAVCLAGFLIYRQFAPRPASVASEAGPRPGTEQPAPSIPDVRAPAEKTDSGFPELSSIPRSVDFALWSEKRVAAYKGTLSQRFDSPVALLEISKIHLEVPVFNGTDEPILNRGVGRIIGTARPGESGNLGIAGHRDGFFRGLKDVTVGDTVYLITPAARRMYLVDNITIVTPTNVEILRGRSVPTLTLVTCYPFYFHGDAPQRYILQCSLQKEEQMQARAERMSAIRSTAN
jgi:LPXTG-site transpeptidase (sortase) family protein